MNATDTGRKIRELRNQQNLTQKELASKINVTDKAVSKWERGLNFPDISLLEDIATTLNTTVIELLGVENSSKDEVIIDMTKFSRLEKVRLNREIRNRARLTIFLCIVVWIGELYASKVLADNYLFGLPQAATIGMSGFLGTIIANGMFSIRNSRNLLK